MVKRAFWVIVLSFVCLLFAQPASAVDPAPAFHEQIGQAWGVLGRELQEFFESWQEHFASMATSEERPPVSMIIRNREKLGLSSEQVRNLERLRNDLERESIRKEADIRVAKMELNDLLAAQPVDMTKVEAKVREIERLRADLRFARIRTVAKGKEQLSAEQRKKLEELLSESQLTRLQP
jgi:Spy/CpxP family protein refolding chaperone